MRSDVKNNKRYVEYNLHDDPTLFSGDYDGYEVPDSILQRLSKELGFSYDLYLNLYPSFRESANNLVSTMSAYSDHKTIFLLLDDEEKRVINYSLDSRHPILNSEFINRIYSLAETSEEIELSEVYYSPEDTIASMIIKRASDYVIEETYTNNTTKQISYDIGVILVNDETSSSYSRLVIYIDDNPIYLPPSYYNATTSRFKRSTNNSLEALEVLFLKILDDLRGDDLEDRLKDFHYRYRSNKEILASYEEYNTLLNTLRKIPTVAEDNSVLEDLSHRIEKFEDLYPKIYDQKSSYIWRCTAIGSISIGNLIYATNDILKGLYAPSIEYFPVRELLGSYASTPRIVEEIASEDK